MSERLWVELIHFKDTKGMIHLSLKGTLSKRTSENPFGPVFNLYAEYIMKNAGLEEAQTGIKISRRNINNLRYADDTTLFFFFFEN